MSLFAYSLNKCGKSITLYKRTKKIINGKTSEVFSNRLDVKALIKTVSGVTVFDDTNTERSVTHEIKIAYIADLASTEVWIFFNGKKLKVVSIENCCENDDMLTLFSNERGDDSKVVNNA